MGIVYIFNGGDLTNIQMLIARRVTQTVEFMGISIVYVLQGYTVLRTTDFMLNLETCITEDTSSRIPLVLYETDEIKNTKDVCYMSIFRY